MECLQTRTCDVFALCRNSAHLLVTSHVGTHTHLLRNTILPAVPGLSRVQGNLQRIVLLIYSKEVCLLVVNLSFPRDAYSLMSSYALTPSLVGKCQMHVHAIVSY